MSPKFRTTIATLVLISAAGAAAAGNGHSTGHHKLPVEGGDAEYLSKDMSGFGAVDLDGDGLVTKSDMMQSEPRNQSSPAERFSVFGNDR